MHLRLGILLLLATLPIAVATGGKAKSDPRIGGNDLLHDLLAADLLGEDVATKEAPKVKRVGCPFANQHGGAGEPCAMGRAALRKKRQQIELQLKDVKYPADLLKCDKPMDSLTLAPNAGGTSFEDVGKGYCPGTPGKAYDDVGTESAEACQAVCLSEADCQHLSFGQGVCMRFPGECALSGSGWWFNQFQSYKKVIPTTPAPVANGGHSSDSVYGLLVKEVWSYFDNLGDTAAQQDYTGCLLRTAGHDFMDFRWTSDGKATGGSDGCINFEDADNTGIPQCLAQFEVAALYKNWCDKVSLGDFLVIIAEAVMARTATSYQANSFDSGTLAHTFMSQFEFGRPTVSSCEEHVGLMPNPEEGCADLKRVFVDHVYLDGDKQTSWKHTAAISGAHTIGKANLENSGYNGTWTTNPAVFDNAYYLRIIDQGWIPQWNINGNQGKNQWIVSDLGRDKPEVAAQMMLNSDLCMVFDNARDSVNCDELILNDDAYINMAAGTTRSVVTAFCKQIRGRGRFVNAKERMCCTWTRADKMFDTDQWHAADTSDPIAGGNPSIYKTGQTNHHCGFDFTDDSTVGKADHRGRCCEAVKTATGVEGSGSLMDCDYPGNAEGPAWKHIMLFAYNETYWLEAYADAWHVATTNVMKYVGTDSNSKFTASNTGNCGCCKENTTYWDFGASANANKILQEVGDEGYEECEKLKTENTYDPSFWTARHTSGSTTWPMFNIDDPARGSGSTKYTAFPPSSTADLTKMEFASEAHVISALRTYLTACASNGCETAWMDNLVFYTKQR
jgi:hypothetical protein